VNTFIRALAADKHLRLVKGDYKNDWMFIDDAVAGIVSVGCSKSSFTDYYIGHREISTFKDKLLEMKEALNSNSELLFGEYPENTHIDYSMFDVNKLYNDTGFECKADFKESIIKTANWLKSINQRSRT
jgi:nucleoside-diphosphate-sugar epimerase